MKKLICIMASFAILSIWSEATEIHAPWSPGETWWYDRTSSSYHTGIHQYCVDFNKVAGVDEGSPILAAQEGRVDVSGWSTTYGWHVWIERSDGSRDIYAHFLMRPVVSKGEFAKTGQVLGLCGCTPGPPWCDGPHLHFGHYVDGETQEITIIDDQAAFQGAHIISRNSYMLDYLYDTQLDYRNPNGVTDIPSQVFGGEQILLDWYYDYVQYDYDEYNCARNCYLRLHPSGRIVYDALGGAIFSYAVYDEELNPWLTEGGDGPRSAFGMPITNAYNTPQGRRQDFQKGYILDGVLQYWSPCAPGWTESGWNNEFSYRVADAYDRNGASVAVGSAFAGAVPGSPAEVHEWSFTNCNGEPDGADFVWIQNFDGGSNGEGAIMYDPDNCEYNELATNEAYYISNDENHHGDFWWRYILTNCPTTGQSGVAGWGFVTRDRYQWPEGSGCWRMDFVLPWDDPLEERDHYMLYDPNNNIDDYHISWHCKAYVAQYLRQNPDTVITVRSGQTQEIWVEFLNTGSNSWTDDPSSNDYVILKSKEPSQYQDRESPFFHSSWINNYTPTAVGNPYVPVAPQDTARFTFTIQAPVVESETTFYEYFQPFNPHTGTWIEDDGDMHFVIKVVSDIVIDTTNRIVENSKIKLRWRTNAVPEILTGVYFKPYSTTTNLTFDEYEEFTGYAGRNWYGGAWVRRADTGTWEVLSVEAEKAVIRITHSPVHQVPFITYFTVYSNSSLIRIDRLFQFSQYNWTSAFLPYLWRCYHRNYFNTYYYSYSGGVKSGGPPEYGAYYTDWDNRWADLYSSSYGVGVAVLNSCLNPHSKLYSDKDMETWTSGITPIINPIAGGLRGDLNLTYFYYIHSGNYVSANLDSVYSALSSDVQMAFEPNLPLVFGPAGDVPFSVTLHDDSSNPLVGCYNVWLDFSDCFGVAHCPSESDWPKVFPSNPSDSGGNIYFYVDGGGYDSGYVSINSNCGQAADITDIKSKDTNADLLIDSSDWLGTPANDYNGDGNVDWFDFELWRPHLGHTCSLGPSCRFSKRLYSIPSSGHLHPGDTADVCLIVTNNNSVTCCVDSVKYSYSGFNIGGRWTQFALEKDGWCLTPGQSDTICTQFEVPSAGHGCIKAKFWTGCCSEAPQTQLNLNSVRVPVGSGGDCECYTEIGDAYGFPVEIKFTPFLPVGWSFLPGQDTVFYDTGQLIIRIIPSDSAQVGDTGSVVAVGYAMRGEEIGSMICQMVIVEGSGVEERAEEQISEVFALAQNYPNPFNPETVIRYALRRSANVKILIYNILGQKVRVLVDEYQTTGSRSVTWDGRDSQGREVTSGVYFYRMKAGDFADSKKMVILK